MAQPDGIQVILLPGSRYGAPGTVVTLAANIAQLEILAGHAADAELTEALAATVSSAATPGVQGKIAFDANFLYVCTVTGVAGKATWKKTALSAA